MHCLRSLLFNIYFYSITILCLLTYGIASYFTTTIAMPGLRHWARATLWGLRNITNVTVEVRGAELIPKGGALVASKHQSTLETILIYGIFQNPAAILKEELTKLPFAGAMVKGAGHIPIDRKAGAKSRDKIISMARQRISENRQVVIFPEGTRSEINSTPSYKRGIMHIYKKLDMPCLPIALNTGMFWPRRGFFIQPGNAILEFLPPIEAGLQGDVFMTELTTRIEGATARLVHEAAAEQTARRRGTYQG